MNNNIIIAAIVGVLVVGGGAFFLLSGDGSDDSANNTTTTNQDNADSINSSDDLLSDANPLGIDINASLEGPFRITLDTKDADGRETSAVVDIDADGNIQTDITDQGETGTFILIGDDVYSRAPGEDVFTKFPSGSDTAPFDTSELQTGLTQDDLDELAELTIVEKGTGSCTAGTCRIYEVTDPEDGEVSEVKVDTATNRLSDVAITNSPDGEELMMSYDYNAPINIQAPENFVEFEIPEIDGVDVEALLESAGQ